MWLSGCIKTSQVRNGKQGEGEGGGIPKRCLEWESQKHTGNNPEKGKVEASTA